jgi:hypothetical protein
MIAIAGKATTGRHSRVLNFAKLAQVITRNTQTINHNRHISMPRVSCGLTIVRMTVETVTSNSAGALPLRTTEAGALHIENAGAPMQEIDTVPLKAMGSNCK